MPAALGTKIKHMSPRDFSHPGQVEFSQHLEAGQGYKVILTGFKEGKKMTSDETEVSGLAMQEYFKNGLGLRRGFTG